MAVLPPSCCEKLAMARIAYVALPADVAADVMIETAGDAALTGIDALPAPASTLCPIKRIEVGSPASP